MNKLRLLANPLLWGIVAFLLFLANLTPWVFPGSAATLMAQLTGAWEAPTAIQTAHPFATLFFGAVGSTLPTGAAILAFNLLSALFMALNVMLLCQIMRHTIIYFADEYRTQPFVQRTIQIAIPVAGLTLLLSPTVWRTATHFQWQSFDLFLALSATYFLALTARKATLLRMGIAATLWGLVALESTEYLALTPFFILVLALAYYAEQERIRLNPIVWALFVPMGLGALLTLVTIIALHLHAAPSASVPALLLGLLHSHIGNLMGYLKGPWILVAFTGLLPGILALFLIRDVGQNRRSATLLFTTLTTMVLTLLAILPTPLSILRLTTEWGETYPVLLAVFTAFAVAGLTAVCALFYWVKRRPEATEERAFIRPTCGFVGKYGAIVLFVGLIIAGITVTVPDRLAQRATANCTQTYCDEVLQCAKDRPIWLLSDGIADVYLALRVAERNLPVTVFSLTQEHHPAALAYLRQQLTASTLFEGRDDLRDALDRALDLGLIPFIQDWIRADAAVTQHIVTLGLPDIWYTSNRLPLPEGLWYRGVADRAEQHTALAALPLPQLPAAEPQPEAEAAKTTLDTQPIALKKFDQYTRRQRGFVANNTAFYLADAGRLEEAYTLFQQVYAYDPDNVSALFNIFELINGGLHTDQRAWCEQEVTALIKRMRGQRYRLWALARTYGYIRSPQLISMLAGSWAMSGQTGAALSGLDLALAMLDDGQKTSLNKAIADLCMTDPTKRKEAISRYQQLLNTSTDRTKSLTYVRELVRMHILENNLEAAKQQLEQVDPTGSSPDLAYERALWFASAGQPDRAQAALLQCLEQNPKHVEALSMMATLQLQAGELELLANKTLPKLRTLAGTDDNYFVQIITAQLAERQNQLEKARTAYLRALQLKPEVHALRTTVLTLDIRLNDKVAAARHAKQFLYQDRTLPLANYVMGSLALSEGDAKRALSYLQTATAPTVNPPLPEAFNDLAEAHRQLGDWPAALAAAQHSCELSPNLTIARETAAAALLELGRYSDAHAYLEEAFAIEKRQRPTADPDPRLYLTRARLHEKEGHPDLARIDLTLIKKAYNTLDATAKAEFDALAQRVQLR